MRGKGFIIFLTVTVTALSLYYLSFTLVSRQVNQDATEYATDASGNIDFILKQRFLDSIRNEVVYAPFFGSTEYTYEQLQEKQLNLGLDLQGGMSVTLEISPVEIIKALSNYSSDPKFLQALEMASEKQKGSQQTYVDLFAQSFAEIAPDQQLITLFGNSRNREVLTPTSTDREVLDLLNKEVNDAIDRSFTILRTRIDRFGTSQPNIQKLENTGRIQIELPGVEDQARVRKLLQGVAKLEFWEVYEWQEVQGTMLAINDLLVAEKQAMAAEEEALSGFEDAPEVTDAAADETVEAEGDDLDALLGDDATNELEDLLTEGDSTGGSLDSLRQNFSDLILLNLDQYGFGYDVKDTAKINDILKRQDVQSLIPSNVKLLWDVKPLEFEGSPIRMLRLYAIKYNRRGEAPLNGDAVTSARQDYETQKGEVAVYMYMNVTGAQNWKRLTRDNIGKRVSIVLDNYVYSAPVVNSEIGDGVSVISGSFNVEEAQDLANVLEAGALPAPVRIVEDTFIGPTLGKLAQRQGILSIVAGLVVVILFMIFYYAKGGIVANVALLFNIFFIFGILAQLSAALTLPGIAGIVLTIGMSIDANVLIFERIREELRNGVGIKAAITEGYKKAFSSIVDANVTTFLTAVILYTLGQGPIKGFAITLIIGIACSFFSAVFITRVIVERMTRKGDQSNVSFATPFSKGWLVNINRNFLGARKKAYIFSGAFITLGMVLLLANGGLNFGVDFQGGRSYVLSFNEPVKETELKTALADDFPGASVEVKTFGSNSILKVTTTYLVDDESATADDQVQAALIAGVSDFTGMQFADNGENTEGNKFSIASSSKVGATIADDIQRSSVQSGIVAIIIIFLYILIRFARWQFSLGAVVALIHDTLFVFSAFAIAKLLGKSFEIDQVFIAAILTIIGYSINDTVVVFDRIRETLNLRSKADMEETFNMAINNTVSRTLITSVTTLVVILVLLIFGGAVLSGFSFALLIGVLIGTYSSIFIATPVVIDFTSKKLLNKKEEKAA